MAQWQANRLLISFLPIKLAWLLADYNTILGFRARQGGYVPYVEIAASTLLPPVSTKKTKGPLIADIIKKTLIFKKKLQKKDKLAGKSRESRDAFQGIISILKVCRSWGPLLSLKNMLLKKNL